MIVKGIVLALTACFIWGLIFIIPQFMGDFSALEIALGRYWFYGAVSLVFLLYARLRGRCRYPLSVWLKALGLSLLSGYYLWVVLAIRYTSPAICALVLGVSPITIAFYGNWKEGEGNTQSLILPSVAILIGLMMINVPQIKAISSPLEYCIGLICCLVALVSWSLYVVLNSRFLKDNPQIVSEDWATLSGVVTLTWVIVCTIVCAVLFWDDLEVQKYAISNDDILRFVAGCAVLGLLCSWLGAFLWNKASVYLPVSLAGQLMIFETIFGIVFAYMLNQEFPPWLECAGIVLLLGAVIYGIRNIEEESARKAVS